MEKQSTPINWDDPSVKYSHPGKTLSVHINEVRKYFDRFCSFYSISPDAAEVIRSVVEYHDMGKLNPAWSWERKKRPTHADVSIRYLQQKELFGPLKQKHRTEFPLVLYFILKHHLPLYDSTGLDDFDLKALCERIRPLVEKMPFQRKVELVDAFGLFKISDSLSASNTDYCPRAAEIEKEKVSLLITRNMKVDNDRWEDQLSLARLPNISFLTAPTGWGKTDASLLFFAEAKVKRVFFLFPTITAINKFYHKLENSFPNSVERYFYLFEYEMVAGRKSESNDDLREIELESFMASHFLHPIMLTTVDQFLLTFLQLGSYYAKRCMFRDAGIILDEVHLLNQKMLYLTLRFLKEFAKIYKLRVLFMSATFSRALMSLIEQEFGGEGEEIGVMDRSGRYRELRRVRYILDDRRLLDLADEIIEQYGRGKKVLVVANTVPFSVKMTKVLEERCKRMNADLSSSVQLLHGRFMYRDRVEKEAQLDTRRSKPILLVSTQVCEVSLDESFDMLFTEMAPLPSLIQRFGRVNRHGTKTDEYNVVVCREERTTAKYPYEDPELQSSRRVLEEIGDLKNEYQLIEKFNEIETLEELQKRYTDTAVQLDFDSAWVGENEIGHGRTSYFFSYRVDEEQAKRRLFDLRDEFTINIIPDPACVEEGEVKRELTDLINKINSGDQGDSKSARYKELRGYMVQVPIWWLREGLEDDTISVHTVRFLDKVYTSRYGFQEASDAGNVL
jgi:CRISPR-associated endonuclease/helicase Cas3